MTGPRFKRPAAVALAGAFVAIGALGVLEAGAAGRYHPVITPSIPRGIYRIDPIPATAGGVARGQYIFACTPSPAAEEALRAGYLVRLNESPCRDHVIALAKRVVAIAGDVVDVDDARTTVNGKPLPLSARLKADGHGRPIPRIPAGRYVLGRGQYWIAGNPLESFDSRYFGPVGAGDVIGRAVPIVLIDRVPPQ